MIKLSNYNQARLNNRLAKFFVHIHYFLKNLAIRAEYRQKLYMSRADIYIKEMEKRLTSPGNMVDKHK